MNTHCCYYNTDCGAGSAWLRETATTDFYEEEVDCVAISVATADEEDGEPKGTFKFGVRVRNVAAKLSDRTFDIDVTAYFTKEELTRLHAVFGLLLEMSTR